MPARKKTSFWGTPKRKSTAKRGSAKKRKVYRAVTRTDKSVRKGVRFAIWGK